MTILTLLASLCLIFQLVTCLMVMARKFLRTDGAVSAIKDWQNQGVTILRPVAGLENNLERTLTSTFHLDHQNYEIIFCVAREDDPVIPLVNDLIKAYPEKPARLLIGNDPISQNPKLNNLIKGWKAAHYEWIVMTDSNVLLPTDYIELVASPPLGTDAENFAADLEAAFLNSYQARWQLCADTIHFGFAQGKTLFCRRDIIEQGGGIEALSRELAEDAAATKLVRASGLKVRISALPFAQPLGLKTMKATWQRQVRWAKLRRDSFALFFYLEIISGPLFPLICLGSACLIGALSPLTILFFFATWYLAEIMMNFIVGWPMSLRHFGAILTRDVLLPALWLSAFGRGGYQWQGHKVKL